MFPLGTFTQDFNTSFLRTSNSGTGSTELVLSATHREQVRALDVGRESHSQNQRLIATNRQNR
eukprot:COSAG02_NODE_2677_length_8267_cov_29.491797_4_plen_63_part_00